jgi:hypothetical protein
MLRVIVCNSWYDYIGNRACMTKHGTAYVSNNGQSNVPKCIIRCQRLHAQACGRDKNAQQIYLECGSKKSRLSAAANARAMSKPCMGCTLPLAATSSVMGIIRPGSDWQSTALHQWESLRAASNEASSSLLLTGVKAEPLEEGEPRSKSSAT